MMKQIMSHADPMHFEFDIDCLMHQIQLMCLLLLFGMDNICENILKLGKKFWATVAKIMHTWREIASAVLRSYSDLTSEATARERMMHKVPPRPLVGRWLHAHYCQQRLLLARPSELCRAVKAAIEAKSSSQSRPGNIRSTLDEISMEEMKAF